jgi:hypothetical protein
LHFEPEKLALASIGHGPREAGPVVFGLFWQLPIDDGLRERSGIRLDIFLRVQLPAGREH